MGSTLLLDPATWDLMIDANGNIALATEPYSLAQDAASAIKTVSDGGPTGAGECYWDTTLGIPYLTQIFRGVPPSLAQLKQMFTDAALTVPDVGSAKCFIVQANDRGISGQIQVTSATTGQTQVADFTVLNPQGPG